MSCKLCRRILTKSIHDLLDLLKSFNSFQSYGFDIILIISVLIIHLDHCIPESFSLSFIVSGSLAQCHCSHNRILISCICTDQTAIALFKAEKISSLSTVLKSQDLLTDKLKSCQNLNEINAIAFCNGICQIAGNNCLDQSAVLRKASVYCSALSDLIVCKKTAGHISCQVMVFAVFIFYAHTQTVCIRICGKNKIRIHFFCKLQTEFKGFGCFRIRIAYCRERAVRKLLLLNNIYVFKAQLLQDPSCRNISGSVKRCINDLQVFALCLNGILMDHLFFQLFHIGIVNLLTDHFIKACFFCLSLVHGFYSIPVGDRLYLSHDSGVMRRSDLSAVLPVYLVSIVFRRVMAGSDINSRNTAKVTDCKRKFRCRS